MACSILLGILFAFLGNSHDPERYGPSILSWLVRQWMDPGSNTSHGWLIPPVSLYVLWRRRQAIRASLGTPAPMALIPVAACLLLYWAGVRTQQPRLGAFAFVGMCGFIPAALWGWRLLPHLLFPSFYLLFAMPLGFLSALSFPLRLLSSAVASGLLNGLGLSVVRSGTVIRLPGEGAFAIDVDDPCSGLNSLIALTAVIAAYAWITPGSPLRKWLLLFSSAPLALAGNVCRIMTIAIVGHFLGSDLALKVYHDLSGFIVFASAVLLLLGFENLIRKYAERLRHWKSHGN